MLNRISGCLVLLQSTYLATFVTFSTLDVLSRGVVFRAIAATRSKFGIQNTSVKLSEYITYPLACTAPLNLALMLIFFWSVLRHGKAPSLSDDFFSICNTIYVLASGWVLFAVFFQMVVNRG
ncbi:MAG: hypothetical protein H7Y36_08150 [Armatimonadetes bacterium]|nr:hypothetical protein [Akkermansiaceae bacterium]